jgi:hypothetical protein
MIGDLLGELLRPVFEITGYYAARVVMPIVTLGRVRVERLADKIRFPWYGFTREGAGIIVMSGELASLIGFVAIIGALAVTVWQLG